MIVRFLPLALYGDDTIERMHKTWPDRYVNRMADYNELSRAAGQEVIGDDEELYIFENLDPDERVGPGHGVKVEVDDSPIDLSAS